MSHFLDGGGAGRVPEPCRVAGAFAVLTMPAMLGAAALVADAFGTVTADDDADALAGGAVTIGSAVVAPVGGVVSPRCFVSAPVESTAAIPSATTSAAPPPTASTIAPREVCGRCFTG